MMLAEVLDDVGNQRAEPVATGIYDCFINCFFINTRFHWRRPSVQFDAAFIYLLRQKAAQ